MKHVDETGFRIGGQTQWLHVASNEEFTYYHISPKRKSLLPDLQGTVVHDHWKAYYKISGVVHSLCNQHHLRELKALIDYDKEPWAKKMQRFLRTALRYRHAYGRNLIPKDKLQRFTQLYARIVSSGITYHEHLPAYAVKAKRGRVARRTGHNLLLRLKNYREDVLRFLTDPEVPFTKRVRQGCRTRDYRDVFTSSG